jgi:SNF2 family DNA or RNA helicase
VSDPECPFRFNCETGEYHLSDWFTLPAQQYNSLFQHQRIGVAWLYDLY